MTRRLLNIVLLAAVVAAGASGAAVASAQDSDGQAYRKYAILRDQVLQCVRDRQWNHLGDTARGRCKRLRKRYVIWSSPGESDRFHLSCLTSRCVPRPIGEPDPRDPPPTGANVFRP